MRAGAGRSARCGFIVGFLEANYSSSGKVDHRLFFGPTDTTEDKSFVNTMNSYGCIRLTWLKWSSFRVFFSFGSVFREKVVRDVKKGPSVRSG